MCLLLSSSNSIILSLSSSTLSRKELHLVKWPNSWFLQNPSVLVVMPLFCLFLLLTRLLDNILRSTPVNPFGFVLSWLKLHRSNAIFSYRKIRVGLFPCLFLSSLWHPKWQRDSFSFHFNQTRIVFCPEHSLTPISAYNIRLWDESKTSSS